MKMENKTKKEELKKRIKELLKRLIKKKEKESQQFVDIDFIIEKLQELLK